MASTALTEPLRVVLFQEGGAWVSQCVDLDLNGQGSTIHEAIRSLIRVFETRVQLDESSGIPAFSKTKRSPPQFVEMFRIALPLKEPTRLLDGRRIQRLRLTVYL